MKTYLIILLTINANFSRKCETPLRYFPSNRGPADITTKINVLNKKFYELIS